MTAKTEYFVKQAYQKLYNTFGPQYWWPGDSPCEIIVGAILTQNTNWKNVEKAIDNLKRNHLLSFRSLHKIPQNKLATLIRPAGYFNVKAKRLKNFINFFYKEYKGSLKKMNSNKFEAVQESKKKEEKDWTFEDILRSKRRNYR